MKLILYLSLLWCWSISLMAHGGSVFTDKSLTLTLGKDWAPYAFRNDNGDADGLDYHLLNIVLANMNYKLRLIEQPEQRMTLNIEKGMVDVTLGAGITEQRQQTNYFSIPYRMETIVFGYRKSRHPDFRHQKLDALFKQGVVAAVNHSGWFGHWFEQDIKERFADQLIHAEGTDRRMSMLLLNRVDIVIGDQSVLQAAAKKIGIDDFAIGSYIINQTPVHFMFSKRRVNETFVAEFNKYLQVQLND